MITPQWRPEENQLRQFAMICLFGFPGLGFVIWRSSGSAWPFIVLATIGVLVCLIGLARPRAVFPVYIVLLAVSLPMGWVVSGILLRLVFFGVITPLGLLFQLFGRDPLVLRRPPGASHWHHHAPPADAADYFRQA